MPIRYNFRSYIAATWRGFNDPQSGLEKYYIRVGTKIGGYDILSQSELPLTDIAVFPNITDEISINTRIYVTVRAYNKAGIYKTNIVFRKNKKIHIIHNSNMITC